MTKQEANRKIVELLAAAVEKYPDQRFVQLLDNLGLLVLERSPENGMPTGYKHGYHEESVDILARVLQNDVVRTP